MTYSKIGSRCTTPDMQGINFCLRLQHPRPISSNRALSLRHYCPLPVESRSFDTSVFISCAPPHAPSSARRSTVLHTASGTDREARRAPITPDSVPCEENACHRCGRWVQKGRKRLRQTLERVGFVPGSRRIALPPPRPRYLPPVHGRSD
ncbi:hypothetical protein ASPZODRAFT_772922 [Penicilliopsis zonata CBS 506.65]|uniref:Uncharacterized protein n=1 Tax=Penicilliopsis zonata CBS 506.65 TaxID=1073090 RepID=A0A1L9SAW8_9EURO|nr:hypothetical protein ASPZODRAFT_772922 [Penicilliopsis zonata CBS 506.65]OJJ44325.1 hypothetical protein ASPZODRAFT_772922 [Penicilliopsis zonata CBS 506.65]